MVWSRLPPGFPFVWVATPPTPVLTALGPSSSLLLPRESLPRSWLLASSILAAASTGNWTSTRMGLSTWRWAALATL